MTTDDTPAVARARTAFDQPSLATPAQVRMLLHRLHQSTWQLAALAVALQEPGRVDPEQRRHAQDVLVQLGLLAEDTGGAVPTPALAELTRAGTASLAAQVAAPVLQCAAVVSGSAAWTHQADEALLAQGRASAQAAAAFTQFGLPALEGMADLLAGEAPVMLDVGVGVASMAVAYCHAFPRLRVVGLDVFPRALELARRTVAEAGMAERIELRLQDLATLEDRDSFALAWLPAPFIPRAALEPGLPRMAAALVPGGWLILAHAKFGHDALDDVLNRFQTSAFGGTPLDEREAQDHLRRAGLEQVQTVPTPEGAPAISVGRRPVGRA